MSENFVETVSAPQKTAWSKASVIIIGPAHPLRGGLASYDERLAKAFMDKGNDAAIYTFSYQYPSFLFPGTTQYSTEPAPENISIHVKINSVNPFNWINVGNELRKLRPDIIVVRYWLPFMGPCLGTILRRVKKNRHTKIICIADNIFPHEKRPGDKAFTNYFLKPIDGFITMSEKVLADLHQFAKGKPAKFVPHPLYDNFGEKISKEEAREKLNINLNDKVILFFGFIRKYKGLDILLNAMKLLKQNPSTQNIKLLIAGEFYEDEKNYQELLNDPLIKNNLILHTEFISDSMVKYYLCAADCVIQPYRNATQSGVTPLAYHFEIPMIVTNVGGLPSLVPDKKVGLIAEPNAESIAEKVKEYFDLGEEFFLSHLREEKKKYSWEVMVKTIIELLK
ncbi:glycosyltransferase [Ginsengibacter hankyongi]|uniref:Glycosyltransferase n=1 Tax=Ginsengibacter hankyongi TaxID=2607284 RepID=A0A5J5IE36_9BACT|nr:glycosyltransferase [Ginsengibacter hankyongi]KAA9036647.1 glycosyltransferase [Ginsengibacter hankyongi]